MDATRILEADHKTVETLFARFEKAGDRAYATKQELVDRIIEELSAHAAIEEQLFYPVARATVPETEDVALESLEEHHVVKWLLSELERMAPTDERFDAKVSVLIESVRHHVKEEEGEFFPTVRGELGRKALAELGEAMAEAKKRAPHHPHPRAPDTPPGNTVVAAAAGMADRFGDAVSGLAQGGVTAASDIIATILGRKKSQAAPTGSKSTRRTATRVRSQAADLTDSAVVRVRKAHRVGKKTVSSAKSSTSSAARQAKRTTKPAKRVAASTARVATGAAKTTAKSARKSVKSTAKSAKKSAKNTATSTRRSSKRTAGVAKRGTTTTRGAARTRAAAATGAARRPRGRAQSR